ncbi:hypothetical protein G7Y79_00002g006590 [Physcia stellaris]|nr:hypothetical protein G7Y79_00002g006590 [Physcia stellaris]
MTPLSQLLKSPAVLAILTLLLSLVSTTPVPYSDERLAEIDALRARGVPEAEISTHLPRLSSPSPSTHLDPFSLASSLLGTNENEHRARFRRTGARRANNMAEAREVQERDLERLREGMVVSGRMGGGLKVRL